MFTIEKTIDRLSRAKTLEDKIFALSGAFGSVPVTVSYEGWSGLEIRLTESGESCAFDAIHWRINVEDTDLISTLHEQFKNIDHTMIGIINKVWMHPTLGLHLGFMNPQDINKMLKRWERFNAWMSKHFPEYKKKSSERAFDWQNPKAFPANTIAWATRCILYGIKPSSTGIKLFKEHKVDISENGILTVKKDSDIVTRWHFKNREERKDGDPCEIDSFGISGSITMCFSRAFADDKDVLECNKVPEQWEVDANVFVGLKTKKTGLFK
jgi:hypothetical protein